MSNNINKEDSLVNLLENNIQKSFIDITNNMIKNISSICNANEAALISIWNELNKNDNLSIKLKQPYNKKKIIFEND
jgi:hypothetical protein